MAAVRQLTPHLLARRDARSDDASDITDWANLLDRAGSYFHGRAAYSQAAPLFVMHWRYARRCSAPSIPIRQRASTTSPSCFRPRATYAAARPLYERALAIREKVLGPEHPDTATSLNNLAILLQAQGDLAGARPLFERALAIREKVLGPEHPDTAASLNNLASLLQAQGDFAAARPLFERALAIREKVLGPEHPDTAASLNNLASLLHAQGDFAAARPLYERALAIREKVLGPEHPDTATSLNNLATCSKLRATLQRRGRSTSAHWPYAKRCSAPSIPIRREPQQPRHPAPGPGRLCSGAAALRARTGHTRKGARPRASRTADSLNNLAILLQTHGDLAGARPLYERALAIREKALGPEHPDTATSLNNLAKSLLLKGDLTGARPLYERALAIGGKTLGSRASKHQSRALQSVSLAPHERPTDRSTRGQRDGAHRSRQSSWTGPPLDQGQCPRHRRRARRAWPHRGGEGAAGTVWAHAP